MLQENTTEQSKLGIILLCSLPVLTVCVLFIFHTFFRGDSVSLMVGQDSLCNMLLTVSIINLRQFELLTFVFISHVVPSVSLHNVLLLFFKLRLNDDIWSFMDSFGLNWPCQSILLAFELWFDIFRILKSKHSYILPIQTECLNHRVQKPASLRARFAENMFTVVNCCKLLMMFVSTAYLVLWISWMSWLNLLFKNKAAQSE